MNIHFISLSNQLNYCYYMAILSAMYTQQYDDIYLWTYPCLPNTDAPCFRGALPKSVIQKEITLDFLPGVLTFEDFCKLPANQGCSIKECAVRIKDIVMWKILADFGGLFLDLDTLCISDISDHVPTEDKIVVWEHNGFVGNDIVRGFYNNAVVLVKRNSVVCEHMFRDIVQQFLSSGGAREFDTFGPKFVILQVSKHPDWFIIDNEVCEVDGFDLSRVRNLLGDDGFVWSNARIIHLHGHAQDISVITPSFVESSPTVYAQIARRYLPRTKQALLASPSRQKRFHVLGLQHLPTNKYYSLSCAYTQKALKLCSMLKKLGHTVFFYGIETSEVECDEFIQVLTMEELERYLGKRIDQTQFYNLSFTEAHTIFDERAINAINARKAPTDFLLCPYGLGHKRIADGVELSLTVESGIGYDATFAPFRVFESYAWMHFVYGKNNIDDGKNYDVVIPNYFDPNDFEFSENKADYFLYIGRLIWRKGIEIAMQATGMTNSTLVVVGQYCGEAIDLQRPHVIYEGYADVEKRKVLLRDAKAVLVPTIYIGPFEGVHVEAWFSGTPVITSDWGVFGETVLHGVTGYRCRTMDHYCWAIRNIGNISPRACYSYAMANFSMDRVALMYDEYFDFLYDLYTGNGWYAKHPDRVSMDWLRRWYPKEATV